jgi:hypothetical protein
MNISKFNKFIEMFKKQNSYDGLLFEDSLKSLLDAHTGVENGDFSFEEFVIISIAMLQTAIRKIK